MIARTARRFRRWATGYPTRRFLHHNVTTALSKAVRLANPFDEEKVNCKRKLYAVAALLIVPRGVLALLRAYVRRLGRRGKKRRDKAESSP
jgi:hypothetical protein